MVETGELPVFVKRYFHVGDYQDKLSVRPELGVSRFQCSERATGMFDDMTGNNEIEAII